VNKIPTILAPVLGIITCVLYLLNLIVFTPLVLFFALFELIIPIKAWRRVCALFLQELLLRWWTDVNGWIMRLMTRTQLDIKGEDVLDPMGWYILICNHRAWLDILVLQSAFNRKVPALKFFMKQELLWMLPFAGIACWAMGFPFMKRYSRKYLKKHPDKIGKDLESTRRACEKFKKRPITVMSFIEGTRFSAEKKEKQSSPYSHLLKPKASGISYVISAMQEYMHNIINVTIVYPQANYSFWHFFCGRVEKVIVRYEVVPIPEELRNKDNKLPPRVFLQNWLNQLWEQKKCQKL